MVALCMVRDERRLALVPATDLDRQRLARLPKNWPMDMQTWFQRTSKLNRWYRGLVGKVAEAIDANPDALHCDLKLKAGLIEQVMVSGAIKGVVTIKLRSTSFPEMEDAEFSNYCDVAVELLFRDYLPHVRSRQRQALISEWAGRRPRLQAPPKLLPQPD